MNTLTSPIPIPNIIRMRVDQVNHDAVNSIATILVTIGMQGGNIYGAFRLSIANGSSTGIRANASPTNTGDILQLFTLTTATGFTQIQTAYNGNGSLAVKNAAVETALIAMGAMPAGTVT